MTSDVSISSQAMLLLRAGTISSFDDGSNEAEILSATYNDFVKSLFSMYPWGFSTKKRRLNQDTTAPINEYQYSHIVPSEAILLWALFDSDSVGVSPVRKYDIFAEDGGARRIYSNYASLWADYTIYIGEADWPPYFTQFAIHALAAHTAMAVTGDPNIADFYERKAFGGPGGNRKGGLFGVAMAMDSKQQRNEFIVSSPLTAARFS